MKKFEDIKWKKHRINGGLQGLIMLPSGVELSIVAGPMMYSMPRAAIKTIDEVSSFEVIAIDPDGEFLGDAKGWQSREDINELIKLLS
tara:strand:- start:13 stop:276 length:264 start_codon:yes stop_codon:yes gene_type:complete